MTTSPPDIPAEQMVASMACVLDTSRFAFPRLRGRAARLDNLLRQG